MSSRGYVRLSQESDTSIERQIEQIEEYADRHDLDLDGIYNEGEGASGWDTNRAEYTRMKQDAADGEFNALVVRDGSRIGRDATERLDLFWDMANKWDVEFHTVERGYIDPDKPTDVLMEVFSAQKDDAKRAEVERAITEINRRVADPDTYHGEPPKGLTFDADGRALVPDPNDREAYDRAMEAIQLRAEGATYTDIREETGLAKSRISRILNRQKEWFDRAKSSS